MSSLFFSAHGSPFDQLFLSHLLATHANKMSLNLSIVQPLTDPRGEINKEKK